MMMRRPAGARRICICLRDRARCRRVRRWTWPARRHRSARGGASAAPPCRARHRACAPFRARRFGDPVVKGEVQLEIERPRRRTRWPHPSAHEPLEFALMPAPRARPAPAQVPRDHRAQIVQSRTPRRQTAHVDALMATVRTRPLALSGAGRLPHGWPGLTPSNSARPASFSDAPPPRLSAMQDHPLSSSRTSRTMRTLFRRRAATGNPPMLPGRISRTTVFSAF